jgi:GNAT superfamily N-acetyltransferase
VIRAARPDDYAMFLAIGTGEGPIATRAQWCESFLPFTQIFERDGKAIGFVDHKPRRGIGFVRNLYVLPEARGAGIGRILMAAAAAWLRAHDVAYWELVVDEDNVPAIALYESLDFVEVDRITTVRLAWDAIHALPAEPVGVKRVIAADIAALEQRFNLDGRLQRALKPDAFACHCEDGVAMLVPPTIPVIRVERPELVGPLLAALRPHAQDAFVDIVLENADDLAAFLVRHVAHTRSRLVRMAGDVPRSLP